MNEPETFEDWLAIPEENREWPTSLEKRLEWQQRFLRLLSETPEYQAYCTPQATLARQAELLKLQDPEGKLRDDYQPQENPR